MAGKLTASKIDNAKAGEKPYKLTDGDGRYLLVNQGKAPGLGNAKPETQKWWRYDYRLNRSRRTVSVLTDSQCIGRRYDYRLNRSRRTLSLGVYPDVSLRDARARLKKAWEWVAAGRDLSVERQKEKAGSEQSNTFEAIAAEWLGKYRPTWAPNHTEKVEGRLKQYVFPWLG